jgi:hypothetical protein
MEGEQERIKDVFLDDRPAMKMVLDLSLLAYGMRNVHRENTTSWRDAIESTGIFFKAIPVLGPRSAGLEMPCDKADDKQDSTSTNSTYFHAPYNSEETNQERRKQPKIRA